MLRIFSLVLVCVISLAACAPVTETPAPADPLSAIVGELSGTVNGKASEPDALAPINLGFKLNVGGQVQTGDDAKARLDFSDLTILRLASNSSYKLEEVAQEPNGSIAARVELNFGRLWVSLTGGELEVETPVAVASVRGSFAIFSYTPGDPNDPTDDLLVVDCLEGSCGATNPVLNEQLGNLERLVLSPQGSLRQPLTAQDVQAFVLENPESGRLVATLTAAPPATNTPAAPASEAPTQIPTETPTSQFTAPVAFTDTPAAAAPQQATATLALLGEHTVRAGETLNCIGRGYGVLPEAIAGVNQLNVNARLTVGARLIIPAVQWTNISNGPVCAPQFRSPYPGLPVSAATATATRAPANIATNTPSAVGTPFISFTADATSVVLGACTNLRWQTANVKEVFLNGQGVIGNSMQSVCPQQTTQYTLSVNTGVATETRTLTITVVPPSVTPGDTQGPSVLRAVVSPVQIGARAPNKCNLSFTAEVTDPSGVAFVEVEWTAYDLQGVVVGSGAWQLQPLSGTTYRYDWANVQLSSTYGSIAWRIVTADAQDNTTTVNGSPNVDVPTSLGGCGVIIP
jgi:hypothetical protein